MPGRAGRAVPEAEETEETESDSDEEKRRRPESGRSSGARRLSRETGLVGINRRRGH